MTKAKKKNILIWKLLVCAVLSSVLLNCQFPKKEKPTAETFHSLTKLEKKPVPIIFDTDISGDYDDVGAMGMLHALADRGEIEILATLASNLSPLVVPTIEVINTYFGPPEIPIGALKTSGVDQDSRELHWPDSLVANYPHTYKSNKDAPDAVKIYRKVLAGQPDSLVTIVTGVFNKFKKSIGFAARFLFPVKWKGIG